MKKFLIFILGVIVGILLTLGFLYYISSSDDGESKYDIVECEEVVLPVNAIRVFQALDEGYALASEYDVKYEIDRSLDVLIINDEKKPYYDKQIIKVTNGMCFKQIGVYRYRSKLGQDLTVPVVKLTKK